MRPWARNVGASILTASLTLGLLVVANRTIPAAMSPALRVSATGERVTPPVSSPAAAAAPNGLSGRSIAAPPWWADLLGRTAWPIALLAALLLVAWDSRLRRIFGAGSRLVRKIKAGGVEMEISAEAADEVRSQLRASFRDLVGSARDEYQRMADLQDVDRRLEAAAREVKVRLGRSPSGMRATVHVRDIVFRDYLYQLVDYYPDGGGAHRRFSQRYGIIGRSWRSAKSHGTGDAFGGGASEASLVEEWGMTRDETHGVLNSRPACLSVLLSADGVEVGILYVDSKDKDAFGDDRSAQALAEALQRDPKIDALAASVGRALAPLRAAGPNLDIKELG